jgi:phosphoribosylaminoimidazolecarboxamide formyltransferase/IMP cyclohydrolase
VGSLDRAGGPIIGRALLAADRKEPIVPLARGLHARGVELYATDGTRRHLEGLGIPCRGTEEITGITGWFGGRVKTLHPKLFGGILAPRDEAGRRELETLALVPFDLVAVLFYPFEEALLAGVEPEEALLERIDVGGPSLLRAAAKNHRYVVPFSDPDDTEGLLSEMERTGGRVAPATRARLAAKAFRRTALYDAAVHSWLARVADPDTPRLVDLLAFARPGETLRYGENPHQRADLLVRASPPGVPLTPWPLVHLKGDALSYNNYLDLERALSLVSEFDGPAAVVVKHATPCGAASAEELPTALEQALETDPVARYGSVVAVNRPLTLQGVDALKGTFVDLLVGPSFPAEVQERLARRPKLKLVQGEAPARTDPRWEARTAAGRLLLQEVDRRELTPSDLHRVTRQAASAEELRSFPFAWKVVRHARSNAVALVRGTATVGIGSGQTSRVGAVRDALQVAGDRARGAVLASDAYFPFADGLEEAGRAGVRVVLQPGGSIRDAEVVAAADRLGLAMYFCGWRVFRH